MQSLKMSLYAGYLKSAERALCGANISLYNEKQKIKRLRLTINNWVFLIPIDAIMVIYQRLNLRKHKTPENADRRTILTFSISA